MNRAQILVFLSSIALLAAACSASTPAAEGPARGAAAAADEKPCAPPTTNDAGAPACEPGCKLVGDQCRPDRGIIVHQGPGSP